MKTKVLRVLLLLALAFSALAPVTMAQAAQEAGAPSLLQFIAGGHALGFTSQGMYAASGSHALHVDFLDANKVQPQADIANNVEGRVASLGRVSYTNLWEGVSLAYTATPGSIYTTVYTISPGADAKNIRLRYNAPLTINRNGTLNIAFQSGRMSESAPLAWQDIQGERKPVDVSFRAQGQEVTFALGAYDPGYALTIDPSLVWNTFLGGSGDDEGNDIAVDGSGNIYVTGVSYATWGSPVRTFTSSLGNPDAFVAKLDSSGNLAWSTFLGGSGGDVGNAIMVDGSGNVYVTGYSTATWGCAETSCTVRAYTNTGGQDAFAAKLDSASGNLTWNTFLGGNGIDTGWGVAMGGGNVYVAGNSDTAWGCSPTACTVRAYTASVSDGFIAKLDSSGNLAWNTFLGGSGGDYVLGIAVDGSGNIYVAGHSDATWGWSLTFPPVRAYTASQDAFAVKLDSSGNIMWNTFLGGSGSDIGSRIAVDGNGNVYVTGESDAAWSCAPAACTVRAYTANGLDAFAVKLDSSGNLQWNTFLGAGGMTDFGISIAVDGSGNAYVTGFSWTTWGSPVTAYTAGQDAFAAKVDSSGNLIWNTFLGGGGNDLGLGIAADTSGTIYVTGYSSATWGGPVRAYTASTYDAFVAKVDLAPPGVVSSICANANPTNRASVNFSITFSETVTNVDTADFSLTTTGVTGASITGLSGSGATRTVTVNTGTGNGTIRLDVPASATITDLAGNSFAGVGYTGGQVYTVNKTLTFNSIGAQDGWVLESGENTNVGGTLNSTATTFRLGDDATRKQYRGILSFSTGPALPDTAVITGVTLKVRQQAIVGGGNPVSIFGGFMVDIKNGLFGAAALQVTDFQTATGTTGHTYGPFNTALAGGWYSINLTGGKAYVNKLATGSGLTQIRLRFKLDDNNNAIANYLSLYSGNTPLASRPQLVIQYSIP